MSIDTTGFGLPKPSHAAGFVTLSAVEYKAMRLRVYREQGGHCAFCGRKIYRLSDGELHHIRKRKMGGGSRDDSRANLEMLCNSCHRREHNQ
jgi:5-methylcytosine-specific restriction endonuclease McrA